VDGLGDRQQIKLIVGKTCFLARLLFVMNIFFLHGVRQLLFADICRPYFLKIISEFNGYLPIPCTAIQCRSPVGYLVTQPIEQGFGITRAELRI